MYSLVAGTRLWRRTVLSQYLEMLKICFPSEYQQVATCGKQSMKLECVGDERTQAYKPLCCRSALCPWCSATDAMRLVDYLKYRVHEICSQLHRKIRFYRYEFTVPFDLQSKVGFEGLFDLDKLAKETLTEYLGKPKGIQLGIAQVPQWWHSSDPFGSGRFGGFFAHIHGVCFDFAYDDKQGRIVSFGKLFVSDDKGFVRLRALWRKKVEARYGASSARDVDCYVRYEEGGDELSHRLRYMFRSPVNDFFGYVKSNGVPSGYNAEWVKCALRGRGHAQRVHYYGWMAPVSMSPKSRFMRFLGLELLDRKSYDKERRKVLCPVCGCLMERIPYAPLEETDDLIARGERFVVSAPPWLAIGSFGG